MGAVILLVLSVVWCWYALPYPLRTQWSAWFWMGLLCAGAFGALYDWMLR